MNRPPRRPARRQKRPIWLQVIFTLAVLGLGLLYQAGGSVGVLMEQVAEFAPAAPQTSGNPVDSATIDGMPTIARDRLPAAGRRTLDLIARGGPFPYAQDGTVFQNREQLLPRQPRGYYREYTVETPGENDRGARRIVAGRDGELYYTDDHYDSFRRIR